MILISNDDVSNVFVHRHMSSIVQVSCWLVTLGYLVLYISTANPIKWCHNVVFKQWRYSSCMCNKLSSIAIDIPNKHQSFLIHVQITSQVRSLLLYDTASYTPTLHWLLTANRRSEINIPMCLAYIPNVAC